jgi:hypothetical protein
MENMLIMLFICCCSCCFLISSSGIFYYISTRQVTISDEDKVKTCFELTKKYISATKENVPKDVIDTYEKYKCKDLRCDSWRPEDSGCVLLKKYSYLMDT